MSKKPRDPKVQERATSFVNPRADDGVRVGDGQVMRRGKTARDRAKRGKR